MNIIQMLVVMTILLIGMTKQLSMGKEKVCLS